MLFNLTTPVDWSVKKNRLNTWKLQNLSVLNFFLVHRRLPSHKYVCVEAIVTAVTEQFMSETPLKKDGVFSHGPTR